jgi:hypothetical protein
MIGCQQTTERGKISWEPKAREGSERTQFEGQSNLSVNMKYSKVQEFETDFQKDRRDPRGEMM